MQGPKVFLHYSASFTTKDRDYDTYGGYCAQDARGGRYYEDCFRSNMNGKYESTNSWQGIHWIGITDEYGSLTFSKMKMRRFERGM